MEEFKVGDKVICPEEHPEWEWWDSEMNHYVGVAGEFTSLDSDGDMRVSYPDGERWCYKPKFLIPAQQIKITKNKAKPKKVVSAYGQSWHVPKWVKRITIDESGEIFAYQKRPRHEGFNYWHADSGKVKLIGQADLNGVDWRETLVEV